MQARRCRPDWCGFHGSASNQPLLPDHISTGGRFECKRGRFERYIGLHIAKLQRRLLPKAAAWLRELIKQNLIPDGIVDTRSITEIKPNELKQYTQCHFFAGIGGWSLALQLAGWPATRPVWTGSCPCQPFSTAGKQLGNADERNLWPIFFNLIRECRPDTVFGEQVANAIGKGTASSYFRR